MTRWFFLFLSLLLLPITARAQTTINLPVPFTSEVPDGQWVAPWNNACEEAGIVMVEQYYAGKESLTKEETKKLMRPLFEIENKVFGSNADTDARRTNKLINEYANFGSKIITDPTLEEIKDELRAGQPVIIFLYGKNLPNPNHRWRRGGSYYHVMVLVGFDDDKGEFIANDSGDHDTGLDYRYKYDTILNALHDFNYKTRQADGPARALFTWSKVLVKAKNSHRIYLISHDQKQYIAHPNLFKKYDWKWNRVKIVDKSWLDEMPSGDVIYE